MVYPRQLWVGLAVTLAAVSCCGTVHSASPVAGIPAQAWAQLADSIAGTILLPNSPGYANATIQWNSRFVTYPVGIVYCNNTEDIAKVLKFAQLYASCL
jgi:hypothetical protein